MALTLSFIRQSGALSAVKKPAKSGMSLLCKVLHSRSNFTSSSILPSPSNVASSSSTGDYVSPFSEFFALMEKGQTTLNTNISNAIPKPEIPLLKCGISENVLKFRTTCYPRLILPPYTQNSEYKVTLKVSLRDIPLETELEQKIFFQIVGSRYIADKKELRLTSEKFASRIENKRYLCSVLDRIVLSSKALAQQIETENVSA